MARPSNIRLAEHPHPQETRAVAGKTGDQQRGPPPRSAHRAATAGLSEPSNRLYHRRTLAILSALIVIVVSVIIIRVATAALVATGLPKDSSALQARSALTGVGFTTSESESVAGHPVRRRIIMALTLVGSAGLATVISSLVVSFVSASRAETFSRLRVLLTGLVVIWLSTRTKTLDRLLTKATKAALARWTDLDVRDLVSLLDPTDDYEVAELEVDPGDWIASSSLVELRLSDEGALVVAIRRANGAFIGTPSTATVIHPYDTVILYGRNEVLRDVESRRGSTRDAHHAQRVREQIEEFAAHRTGQCCRQ